MPELDKERVKLVNRAKRIHGQMARVERSLTEKEDCTDVLMLLAAVFHVALTPLHDRTLLRLAVAIKCA